MKSAQENKLEPKGIKVKWHEIDSGAQQATAMASGALDVGGVLNTTSVQMANAEGNPVMIVAGAARPTDVFALVGQENGAKTFADLKGKTIAGPKGTVLHQLLVAGLAKEGLTINDVNFVQMGIPQGFSCNNGEQCPPEIGAHKAECNGYHLAEYGNPRQQSHGRPVFADKPLGFFQPVGTNAHIFLYQVHVAQMSEPVIEAAAQCIAERSPYYQLQSRQSG